MRHYHNPLYVSYGVADETEGLKQALSLARNNGAPLGVLVVCPEFPEEFPDYRKKYEEALVAQAEASIRSTKKAIKQKEGIVDITIELVSDNTPSIKIIQYVLRHGHDLLIKEAELLKGSDSGFKAIDMELLRQCPCAMWLCRPIAHSRQHIQVAVAIDPESMEQAAKALSKRMLELSRSLADSCSGELHIVSCWDYEFESFLRDSIWIKATDAQIAEAVQGTQHKHRTALEGLIKASGISGNCRVHHLRGKAEECIPSFVTDKKIDILVMGTVARTGIPGFIIGNTAENIVQNLSCSLMALKPQGFVSPVKAY
ncbi:universal stress protein [Kordiimonas lipolytica]|uniref:Universal stress protein n=1 Tax=Kordiimonas lipolytica TaxID=1662421 RepID=A0ABV8U8L9_9PROT|nr:universal stress protein [Kordiimonas lipolytica]